LSLLGPQGDDFGQPLVLGKPMTPTFR